MILWAGWAPCGLGGEHLSGCIQLVEGWAGSSKKASFTPLRPWCGLGCLGSSPCGLSLPHGVSSPRVSLIAALPQLPSRMKVAAQPPCIRPGCGHLTCTSFSGPGWLGGVGTDAVSPWKERHTWAGRAAIGDLPTACASSGQDVG